MKAFLRSSFLFLSIFLLLSNLSNAATAPALEPSGDLRERAAVRGGGVRSNPSERVFPPRRRVGRTTVCSEMYKWSAWAYNGTVARVGLTGPMVVTSEVEEADEGSSLLPQFRTSGQRSTPARRAYIGCLGRTYGCMNDAQSSINQFLTPSRREYLMHFGVRAVVWLGIIGGVKALFFSGTEEGVPVHITPLSSHGRFLQETTSSSSLTFLDVGTVMLGNLGQDMWRWAAGILTRRDAPRVLCAHASRWCGACVRGADRDYRELTHPRLPHEIFEQTILALGVLSSVAETLAPTALTEETITEGQELAYYFHRGTGPAEDPAVEGSDPAVAEVARILIVRKIADPVRNFVEEYDRYMGGRTFLIGQRRSTLERILDPLIPAAHREARNVLRTLLNLTTNTSPSVLGVQVGRTADEVRAGTRYVSNNRRFLHLMLLQPRMINQGGIVGMFLLPLQTFTLYDMARPDPEDPSELLRTGHMFPIDWYTEQWNTHLANRGLERPEGPSADRVGSLTYTRQKTLNRLGSGLRGIHAASRFGRKRGGAFSTGGAGLEGHSHLAAAAAGALKRTGEDEDEDESIKHRPYTEGEGDTRRRERRASLAEVAAAVQDEVRGARGARGGGNLKRTWSGELPRVKSPEFRRSQTGPREEATRLEKPRHPFASTRVLRVGGDGDAAAAQPRSRSRDRARPTRSLERSRSVGRRDSRKSARSESRGSSRSESRGRGRPPSRSRSPLTAEEMAALKQTRPGPVADMSLLAALPPRSAAMAAASEATPLGSPPSPAPSEEGGPSSPSAIHEVSGIASHLSSSSRDSDDGKGEDVAHHAGGDEEKEEGGGGTA